jgi:hypothetical protein
MVVVVSTLVAFLVVVRVLAAAKPREERPRIPAAARAGRTAAQAGTADDRYAGETSAVVT